MATTRADRISRHGARSAFGSEWGDDDDDGDEEEEDADEEEEMTQPLQGVDEVRVLKILLKAQEIV